MASLLIACRCLHEVTWGQWKYCETFYSLALNVSQKMLYIMPTLSLHIGHKPLESYCHMTDCGSYSIMPHHQYIYHHAKFLRQPSIHTYAVTTGRGLKEMPTAKQSAADSVGQTCNSKTSISRTSMRPSMRPLVGCAYIASS